MIETSTTWGVELVRGIGRYAHAHGPWLIFNEPRGRKERQMLPDGWEGQGVIARINHPALAEQIRERRLPAVNVSWFGHAGDSIARVTNDEAAIGALAAQHLLDRGLRSIAVFPPHDRPGYVDQLTPAVLRAAASSGAETEVFDLRGRCFSTLSWRSQLESLAEWLSTLSKPVGVVAFSDVHARRVTDACRVAGLDVPREVAVLGCEHDELNSLISAPQITSIQSNGETVGFVAAQTLAAMFDGSAAPNEVVRVPHGGIVTRQSTDLLATDDHELRRACEFIRDNAHRSIGVEDILDHVMVSRRVLERKFMKRLGVTPGAVIRRTRLECATRLLYDTDFNLNEIAVRVGFGTADTLARVFRSEFGKNPSEMRRPKPGSSEPTR